MTREQLEHIIRAAATIAEDDDLVIVGSQAILGEHPDAPPELLVSDEADVYPRNRPERWDLIDGSIGELSPFHRTFGYYAQGVQEGTATLAQGWQARLIPVRTPATRGATGWCISTADLVVSKYIAGRPKDRAFVRTAIRHRLVEPERILALLDQVDISPDHRARLREQVQADGEV